MKLDTALPFSSLSRILITTTWGASIAIPLGLGISAGCFTSQGQGIWAAVVFVALATVLGLGFAYLQAYHQNYRKGRLLLLTDALLLSVVLGWLCSSFFIPISLLVSAAVFWITTDTLWKPIKQSIAHFPYRSRLSGGLMLALALLTLIQVGRFSLFMVDPQVKACWPIPYFPEPYRHQCLAAYVHAGLLNEKSVDNIYNPSWYDPNFPSDDQEIKAEPLLEDMDGLLRDLYQYPPQALVWPTLGLKLTRSYASLRVGWYALQACIISLLLVMMAHALGRGSPAFTILPLMWFTMPLLTDLNYGQPHFLVVCMAAGALILFDKKCFQNPPGPLFQRGSFPFSPLIRGLGGFRFFDKLHGETKSPQPPFSKGEQHISSNTVLGGLLLALAISVKIYPVLLTLLLLGQRRYKALISTIVWSIVLALIALPIVGWAPYQSFFEYKALQIIGGDAWKAYLGGGLWGTGQLSLFGILLSFKTVSQTVADAAPYGLWIYNIGLLTVIVIASRRKATPLMGLALVNLAASASYYTPPSYAMTGTILLILLSFGDIAHNPRRSLIALTLLGFLTVAAFPEAFPIPYIWSLRTFKEVVNIVAFFSVIALNVRAVFYRTESESTAS